MNGGAHRGTAASDCKDARRGENLCGQGILMFPLVNRHAKAAPFRVRLAFKCPFADSKGRNGDAARGNDRNDSADSFSEGSSGQGDLSLYPSRCDQQDRTCRAPCENAGSSALDALASRRSLNGRLTRAAIRSSSQAAGWNLRPHEPHVNRRARSLEFL